MSTISETPAEVGNSERLAFRVDAETRRRVVQRAKEAGMSTSLFCRAAVIRALSASALPSYAVNNAQLPMGPRRVK